MKNNQDATPSKKRFKKYAKLAVVAALLLLIPRRSSPKSAQNKATNPHKENQEAGNQEMEKQETEKQEKNP